MSYPELIRLLMDRSYRDEQLKRVNQKLLAGSALADGIAREYTLNEIAIITRAGPARLLGLRPQGPSRRRAPTRTSRSTRAMRTSRGCSRRRATSSRVARWWSKRGSSDARQPGKRLHVQPGLRSTRSMRDLGKYFDAYSSVRVRQLSRERFARHAGCNEERADGHPRRAHRRHVRRGVRDARRAHHHHREEREWAREAANKLTGFATSVIACKCEAAIERELSADRRRRMGVRASACCSSRWTPTASASA